MPERTAALIQPWLGPDILVGARYEDSVAVGVNGNHDDNGAANSGAVYVY
jgi:hypothetical protein